MFEKYGIMTIKKDSILYMLSKHDEYDNIDEINNIDNLDIIDDESKQKLIESHKPIKEYPILVCNFHPSESNNIFFQGKYIYHIKLKRDIKILFMIKGLLNRCLLSDMRNIINCRLYLYSIEFKKLYLKEIKNLLATNYYDGWFVPNTQKTEGYKYVEIGLSNDKNLYTIVDVTRYDKKWGFTFERDQDIIKNMVTDKNKIKKKMRLKYWGEKYKICSIERPIKLDLHIRYKKLIRLYRKREFESGFFQYLTFQVVLSNSEINYYGSIQDIIKPELIF